MRNVTISAVLNGWIVKVLDSEIGSFRLPLTRRQEIARAFQKFVKEGE